MAAINITEKDLSILVNGTQEGSFSQRANSASYDITTSALTSFNYTGVVNASFDTTYNVSNGGLFFCQVSINSTSSQGYEPGLKASLSDGTTVLQLGSYNGRTTTGTYSGTVILDDGGTIDMNQRDTDGDFYVERADETSYFFDRESNIRLSVTEPSIDNITQS